MDPGDFARTWTNLKASNTGAGDGFGEDIALSPGMMAVGARFEDNAATGVNGNQNDDTAKDSGAVYRSACPAEPPRRLARKAHR